MTVTTINKDRYSRYSGVVPTDRLMAAEVAIVGCGAVGRQAALQLAAMGVGTLRLCDFDTVEAGNLGPQGWCEADIGKPKVEALAAEIARINPACKLTLKADPFDDTFVEGAPFVLACADNMDVRKAVFLATTRQAAILFADARMGAESLEVHYAYDAHSCAAWEKSWFPQKEAFEGTCTAKATIYCANITAAYLVRGVAGSIREELLPRSIRVNLLAMESDVERVIPEPQEEEAAGPGAETKPQPATAV